MQGVGNQRIEEPGGKVMKAISLAIDRKMLIHILFSGTLALFICLFPPKVDASDARELFSQGNRAYAEGKYDEALTYYKAVMEKDGLSASLLYNMANAYYQKKEVGWAILNYERALYLDPGNPDIQANLRLAKKEFGLSPEPPTLWKQPFNILNLDQWVWLGSIALGAFCFLFFFGGIAPKILPRKLLRRIAGVLLVFIVVSCAGVTLQYMDMNRGVITGDNPRLLVSPFDSASSSAQLRDGQIVRIAKAYKNFVLVKGPGGNSGWIAKGAIEPVIPSHDWSKSAT